MKEMTGFESDDIEKKVVAAFAYLIFFIPLLAAPDSKFAKFHANQGFWLLIINLVGIAFLSFVPLLGGLLIYFY